MAAARHAAPTARRAALLAAAAFALGLPLGAPHSAADTPPDAGSATAGPARGQAPAERAQRQGRSPRPAAVTGSRSADPGRPGDAAPRAADGPATAADPDGPPAAADPDGPAPRPGRPARGGRSAATADPPSADRAAAHTTPRASPDPTPGAPAGAAPRIPAGGAPNTPAADAPSSPDPAVSPPAPAVAADPPVVAAPVARAAAAPAPATVGGPLGAAAAPSLNDVVDELLGQFRALFEGAALLVRRSLFNEVPELQPVQLTGLRQGPITGTLGAVDPEGDPLSYRVATGPAHGAVTLGSDGGYTYTPGPGFTGADSFAVTATDGGPHINLLDLSRPAGATAQVAVAQNPLASATVRFQFVYGAGAQQWSPEARRALSTAAARLGSHFAVADPVVITYAVTGRYSPLSSTLATAGSDFVKRGGNGLLPTVVQEKIQTGRDANGSAADGAIDWNFGHSWGYGDSMTMDQYDFQSIAMHEMVHTLGFVSNTVEPNSNTGSLWSVYDGHLASNTGEKAVTSDYRWNAALRPNLTGGNGGLYFNGPNAVAANSGPVPLHTPNPWALGGSVSHLGARVSGGQTLMKSVYRVGPGVRDLGDVELAILRDIGYQVTAPNPAGGL